MTNNLSDTLAALSEAATQDNPWFYGEPDVGLAPEPFFGKPLDGDMRPMQPMTRQDEEFVVALWTAYREGQLVPVPSVVSWATHTCKYEGDSCPRHNLHCAWPKCAVLKSMKVKP